ncbi:SusC/RagA family TonB-linked outer membrane protein [Namhaeicola litoreus]|uniref:SusC/RagA family TonB-linked outer membrane protein n=1 Tax=Namhaeicola litoreus TaxID=1052145 RepID=A0ABW3Y585_9FLAO
MKDNFFKKHLMKVSFFIFFLLSISIQAQLVTVKGKVTELDGIGLPGVNIIQKGTSNGVVTDLGGNYSIQLQSGSDVLVYSFVGYETIERSVGVKSVIDVILKEDSQSLEEVVIVGYAATKRKDILGSVASIKSEDIAQTTPVNALDGIQGRLSGVQISSNGGPGSGSSISIRGTSTFSGGVNPLYVVDGQQLEDIDNLDPSDIASIEVLKDGASAAIYGSKSANGVVIITTKSGTKGGQTRLDVNAASSYSFLNSAIPVANSNERIYYEQVRGGTDPNSVTRPADSLSLLYANSNDLQKLVTRVGRRDQINVAVSGGGEKNKYYWNTGYLQEQGIVINSGYKRINSLARIDADIFKNLTAGTKLLASYEIQKGLNENTVFQQIAERIPYFPVFEPDGSYTPEIAGRQNPIAEANERTLDDRNFRAQSFNYLQWQILPSLSFRSTLGINFRLRKQNEFNPTIVQRVGTPPDGRERQTLSYDLLHENFLTYRESFGDHNLSGIAGFSLQKWDEEFSDIRAQSFLSDFPQTFNNVDELRYATTSKAGHSLTGLFADLAYDYKGKYLIKGTIRRDGSSRFGEDKKYGVFPSVQVGWRLSGEKFMENTVVSNLLFRASYGETGNERIGNYESLLLYQPGYWYGTNGIATYQLANPDLGWESTISTNFGVDLSMFKNRFNLTFDLWQKTTEDLLYDVPLPEETGFIQVRKNIGSVENRGFDLSLSGTIVRSENFQWFSSFNISYLQNEVKELADEDGFQDGDFYISEGEPIGNMYGYRNLGVFPYDESNAFTNDGVQLSPNFDIEGNFVNYTLNGQEYTGDVNRLRVGSRTLRGGDIYWEDVNGDFNIDGANDRQVIGNGLPEYFGGFFNEFTIKNFSFSFLFDYNFGNDIYKRYDQLRNDLNSSNETPSPDRIAGAWTKPGDIAEFASLDRGRTQNRLGPNSQYILSGDYIRLRNIRFQYNIAQHTIDRISWMKNFGVYMSLNNLLTWTNYDGYNPELGNRGNSLQPGVDNLRYPNRTEVIIGVNISL